MDRPANTLVEDADSDTMLALFNRRLDRRFLIDQFVAAGTRSTGQSLTAARG